MEAKIKAIELMQRFNEPTQQWDEVDGFIPHKHNAKTCALIAVDEILKYQPYDIYSIEQCNNVNNYWQEVKQEIEKL